MPRENTTRFALLGVLRIAPGSGYDIKKLCDMSISHFWNENYGRIYPMLKTLESEGLVTKEAQLTPGRPPRNVYRITQKGTDELMKWLRKPPAHHPPRFELILKVFLGQDVPQENMIEKLRSEREQHEKNLRIYQGIEEHLRTSEPEKSAPGLPFWLASLDFGKRFSAATIEWCDETIRAFESRAGKN